MALNNITFVKGAGGLGRALPSKDNYSGLILYVATLPSGFTSGDRIKQVFSVEDAETLGILDDYSDETKATATYTFTTVGADGDTVELTVAEPKSVVSLGEFTKTSAESTVTLLAAAYVALINAGTITHGYTASNVAGVVTIVARPKLGVFLNTGTPIVATIVGTIAGTIAQFGAGALIDGIASKLAVYHYHISEFFRLAPQGVLYVSCNAIGGTHTFTEIDLMQAYAIGEIRQIGIYVDDTTFATSLVTAAQTRATAMEALSMPVQILLGCDQTAALSTLTDLSTLASKNVSVVISQDGYGLGFELYKQYGKSITNLGVALGCVSLSKVSEDIAWVGKFNISDGYENNVPAFANGVNFSVQTTNLIAQLNLYRFIFVRTFVGLTGSYFNDDHCAVSWTSDYAYIDDNRVIDKAIRGIRTNLLPQLNAPLTLNSDGTLTDVTIAYFEGLCTIGLDQMIRDTELSAYDVTIDPSQDVLTTSTLTIAVTLIKNGVARNIVVNIGFGTSI